MPQHPYPLHEVRWHRTDAELGPERTHNPGCAQGFAGTSPGELPRPWLERLLVSTLRAERRVTQLRAQVPTGWPCRHFECSREERLHSRLLSDQPALGGVRGTIQHCQLRADSAARVHHIEPHAIKRASREVKRKQQNMQFGTSPHPHGTYTGLYNPSQTPLQAYLLQTGKG